MIKRALAEHILAYPKSALLLGPRQVGKSTLLQGLTPDLSINLARENDFLRYSADMDLFSQTIEASNARLVLVDEIQRIPGLLNTIQVIVDESKSRGRPIRFLLSGSSARKLRRGRANLLPGRLLSYRLGGLAASELDYNVDPAKALQFGFLPEPYLESDGALSRALLTNYSAIYLKEEIQAEALSRDIQGFARFLSTMGAAATQIVDFSKLATKSKVSRSSCVRFVEILEDTLVAERIPVFQDAEGADTIKHPKLYFFDVGVLNGLVDNFTISADRVGPLFESAVFSQLRNSGFSRNISLDIQYFRTRHGVEVDFIVTLNNEVWAIEVKAGEPSDSDFVGLKAFKSYYPQTHRCVMVALKGVDLPRERDGILICNWMHLLKTMGL